MKGVSMLLALGGLASGCDDMLGDAWLIAEATSPDNSMVAQLWCEHVCDVPGRAVLTIVPIRIRPQVTRSEVEGYPPTADLPEGPRALIMEHKTGHSLPDLDLAWMAEDRVQILAPCPSVRERTRGLVTVDVRSSVSDEVCRSDD